MLRATRNALVLAAGLTAVAAPTFAADESPWALTGSVGFYSDYLYRGISQSENDVAVQGNIELSYKFSDAFQPYLNVWGSSIDFTDASAEIDITPGVRGTVFGGLMYDVNVIYYWYPGTTKQNNVNAGNPGGATLDFIEPGFSLAYDFGFVIPKVGFRYSPDFFAETNDAYFLYGEVSVPLPFFGDTKVMGQPVTLALFGHVGHQWIKDNVSFGTPDYTEWNAGVTLGLAGLNFSVGYYDTDLKKSECYAGLKLCDGRFVGSVSKTF